MTYLDIANMTSSGSLILRLSAAAAQEQASGAVLDPPEPDSWAGTYRWHLVSAPGWSDAWASAGAAGNPDPGADEGVITDAMILAQTQAVIAAVAAG
jgi:hypothetical protein